MRWCFTRSALLCVVVFAVALPGCRRRDASSAGARQAEASRAPVAALAENPDTRPRVVALGDSLTAGLGLLESQAYPALLQEKIDEEGYEFSVVNAGISGDTSAAGLQRLNWALEGDVKVLILELGANDGLRGLPVEEMKKNLAGIIDGAQQRGISVLLLGMEAPPNVGPEYTTAFRAAYRDLAKQYRVAFVPFMLDRVAGDAALNQADGIHPNAQGTRIVADTIWKALKPMLDAVPS